MLNWRAIDETPGQQVKSILYLTNSNVDDGLAKFARCNGWAVFEAPRVSEVGMPYLKEMYSHASSHFTDCVFYGFSNGDILYSRDLLVTLDAIAKVTTGRGCHRCFLHSVSE